MEAGSDEEYMEVGRFKFSTEQFRVMNKIVLKCLNEPYWKWVIIDEIGPLELNQQRGFWPALRQILNGIFSATVVVVARQTLSGTIRDMFEENGLEVSICSASEFQQFTA
jgi:nucleoside-triphosphatase THEP1